MHSEADGLRSEELFQEPQMEICTQFGLEGWFEHEFCFMFSKKGFEVFFLVNK